MTRLAIRETASYPVPKMRAETVVLAVGDVYSLKARVDADLVADSTAFAEFSDITPELIEAIDPEVVLSAVLCRNFDCVDLAERLSEIGFAGCYRLIGHGMPQPELVLREIRALFPGLRVELDTARG